MATTFSKIKEKVFYGWVVVAAGLIISLISFGIRYSFGVFFKSIESEFDLTRAVTSGIFSVYMMLAAVFAVLGGWALDKYGPRRLILFIGIFTGLSLILTSQASAFWHLFISYSLLLALGTGAIFPAVNSTVSRWFYKRRGFALGIASSGGGVGTIVVAPFATYLIFSFDWRTALIILGIIAWLIIFPMAILFKKDPGDMGLLPDGEKSKAIKIKLQNDENISQGTSLSLLEASRTSTFWFLGIIWLLLSVNVHLMLTHTVPNAIDLGISPIDAAGILSLMAVGAISGRIVTGRVSDSIGRKVPIITCALLQVGVPIWLIWIRDLWMFYLFAVVFGLSWGGIGSLVIVLIGDVFGVRNIGAIMGTMSVGWNIGAAIGPVVGGYIFDISNNYSIAFLAGAAAMLIATLFAALIRVDSS